VHSIVKYLDSTAPLLSAGALQALYFIKGGYDWKANPGMPALMDNEIAAHASRFIETRDVTILQPLALYLGIWKSDTSRDLLWRIVEQGTTVRGAGADLSHLDWRSTRPAEARSYNTARSITT